MSSIPDQQKALFIMTLQGEWRVASTDVPTPRPGQVLVRVEAAALNPVDWKIKEYGYPEIDDYPVITGSDSAGVVVKVGEGVRGVAVGDRVMHQGAYNRRAATFQQFTVINADMVAKIPSSLTFDQAATVPVSLAAAITGLYGDDWESGGAGLTPPWKAGGRGKYVGQPIVVFGGASAVGQYVIQLATLSGFSPIITTVSPHNNTLVTSLGATHTLDRSLSPSSIADTIKSITSEPVKVVYDAIALADTQSTAYDILASNGTLVVTLPITVETSKLVDDKRIVSTIGVFYLPRNRDLGLSLYTNLTALLECGDLKPIPVEYLPGGLRDVPEAAERMKNGQVSGKKLVVRPQETV